MSSGEDAFAPLDGAVTVEDAGAALSGALAGADDGELFFERRRVEALSFDDGRLRNASYDAAEGFGLRVVAGEAVGYAHADEISAGAIRRAADAAGAARDGYSGHAAPPPGGRARGFYPHRDPLAGGTFDARVTLMQEIDAYLRAADPRVVQASASLVGGLQEVEILRANGQRMADARPMTRLNISVIVENNGRRETGSCGAGGRHEIDRLITPEKWRAMADEALRMALVNLEAEDAPAGPMEVALGPGWPGVLLHEAVGHGLEGDFNRKKTSAFAGLMGEMVAAPNVTVIDDGTIAEARGSLDFDDEGEPTESTVLIENGRLVGYMQDRQNARLMGTRSTGNGRRQSYAHCPMVRMTNTYMAGGEADPAEVVAAVRDGIYAVQFGGGQVDITNGKFVFSCTEAYRVKNGKILHPIKGATLIGDGASALKRVRLVANNMALDPGIGTCGKNGQGVPVTVGQPTMLIDDLTVGGRAA